MEFLVQNISTSNDKNGNPRRLWVVYKQSEYSCDFVVHSVYDEGYGGKPSEINKYPLLPTVWVMPQEYRTYKKMNVPQYSA